MKVLQLAAGYFGNKLYSCLFSSLSDLMIENTVYVSVHKTFSIPNGVPPEVIVSPCFSTLDRVLFYSKQNKLFKDVISKISMNEIDIVHAHTLFSTGFLALKLYEKYGIPYIVAVRSTDYHIFFKHMPHLRTVGIEILRHAEKVIFLSPQYKEKVINEYIPKKEINFFEKKIVIIPNGIDSIFFNEKREAEKTRVNTPLRILYVGEIIKRKNIIATYKAINLLVNEGNNVQYRVVGQIKDKKYENFLKSHAEIEYYPKCSHGEVIDHMRWADIFVMPSYKETFGLVYAEAMSQGLPIIYTKNEGFDGQFKNGLVGYAVNPHCPVDIKKKIESIIVNYSFFSRNALVYVEKFSWKDIALQYKDIYLAQISSFK